MADFDIEKLIDRVITNDFNPSVFSEIDDSDLPTAPNVVEFCMGKQFLNIVPYPRQIQIMMHLYEDFCPSCSNPAYINSLHKQTISDIQDNVQFLLYGKCPKCGKNRLDFYNDKVFKLPYELDACLGQRSGKSTTVAMCSNYTLHRFLKLGSPSHYLGLLPNSTLHGTFTALTFEQATETLYDPFRDQLEASPWFMQLHDLLDYYGKRLSEELYTVKDTYVWYGHRRLTIYPKGPDKRKMRGRTRFLYSVDEIGWFSGGEDAQTLSADEVDHALARSMTTVRQAVNYKRLELKEYDAPQAMAFNISSPAHANDKIMRLLRAGVTDPTKCTFHYPTWEAHPKITRASLEPEFKRDPIAAERDYGANPPISDNPFIGNEDAIKKCFRNPAQSTIVSVQQKIELDSNNNPFCYEILKFQVSDRTCPFVLTLDAGHTNNSFSVVLSHWEHPDVLIHDLVLEVYPYNEAYVNFNKVYTNIIIPIFNHFNVVLVAADRWNSIKILQDAENQFKCKFQQYSLAYADCDLYRRMVLEGRVVYPKTEQPIDTLFNATKDYKDIVLHKPVLHSALQLFTVKESGRRVEKGDGLTDDIFRAATLASYFIFEKKNRYLRVKGGKRSTARALGGMIANSDFMGSGRARTSRLGGVQTIRNRIMNPTDERKKVGNVGKKTIPKL
jgi:hypothetical protein